MNDTLQDTDAPAAPETSTEATEKKPKQNLPWYQTLKSHDRGQRPGMPPRGSRRSMGKR